MGLERYISEKEERLDIYLAEIWESKSRSSIQKKIKNKEILVNNSIKKANYILKIGDVIDILEAEEKVLEPQNMQLNIIFEDDDILIINKEQGMVVHPIDKTCKDTLVNGLIYSYSKLSDLAGELRPGIVHRLDKETSGLLVVAKNNIAHENIAEQFKNRTALRRYIALAEGVVQEDTGTVDEPVMRNKYDRRKMIVSKSGKPAVSKYKVIKRFKEYTLVEVELMTGRTHQVRVHMKYIGHPIVGDIVYGKKRQKFNLDGQLLHAMTLGFIHPTSNEYVEFSSKYPDRLNKTIEKIENMS